MNHIDKLAWIFIENNKLLCAKSKGKEAFYIPGGKRDAGETDQQALIREIKEELSVDLQPETLRFAGTFLAQADQKADGTVVKITCYFADYTGTIQAASEIEEVMWLNHKDKKICSQVTGTIMDWLKIELMIE